jgi:hypothetical protein
MQPLWKLYTRQLHEQLRYRGTWLPNASIAIGTVGVLRQGIFEALTSLEELGISYARREVRPPDGTFNYRSSTGVTVAMKARGATNGMFSAVTDADAGALVTIDQAGGLLLELRGVTVEQVANKHELCESLLDSLFSPIDVARWQQSWVVITEVVHADTATVIVASEGGSRLELKANASIAPAGLVDADARFTVAGEQGVAVQLVAAENLSPLYNGLRLKKRFFRLYSEFSPAGESIDPDPERVFEELDPSNDEDT